jgi:hypothetical protein
MILCILHGAQMQPWEEKERQSKSYTKGAVFQPPLLSRAYRGLPREDALRAVRA